MATIDDAIAQADDGSWTFTCPVTDPADVCGDPAAGFRFTSSGWPQREHAIARGRQHIADHLGEPAPSLDDFRAEHGLVVAADGSVVKAGDLA